MGSKRVTEEESCLPGTKGGHQAWEVLPHISHKDLLQDPARAQHPKAEQPQMSTGTRAWPGHQARCQDDVSNPRGGNCWTWSNKEAGSLTMEEKKSIAGP